MNSNSTKTYEIINKIEYSNYLNKNPFENNKNEEIINKNNFKLKNYNNNNNDYHFYENYKNIHSPHFNNFIEGRFNNYNNIDLNYNLFGYEKDKINVNDFENNYYLNQLNNNNSNNNYKNFATSNNFEDNNNNIDLNNNNDKNNLNFDENKNLNENDNNNKENQNSNEDNNIEKNNENEITNDNNNNEIKINKNVQENFDSINNINENNLINSNNNIENNNNEFIKNITDNKQLLNNYNEISDKNNNNNMLLNDLKLNNLKVRNPFTSDENIYANLENEIEKTTFKNNNINNNENIINNNKLSNNFSTYDYIDINLYNNSSNNNLMKYFNINNNYNLEELNNSNDKYVDKNILNLNYDISNYKSNLKNNKEEKKTFAHNKTLPFSNPNHINSLNSINYLPVEQQIDILFNNNQKMNEELQKYKEKFGNIDSILETNNNSNLIMNKFNNDITKENKNLEELNQQYLNVIKTLTNFINSFNDKLKRDSFNITDIKKGKNLNNLLNPLKIELMEHISRSLEIKKTNKKVKFKNLNKKK